MKPQLAYIPALVVILLVCVGVFGFSVYKSLEVFKKSSEAAKAIENSKKQLENLKNEQANIVTNVKADKSFQEYFARWYSQEGDLNSQRVLERARGWAEASGVVLSEGGASSAVEEPDVEQPALRSAIGPGRAPARPGMRSTLDRRAGASTQVEVVLTGSFQNLAKFIALAENEISSLRVTKLSFSARSSEEVRLATTLAFKVIGREAD